MQFQYTYSFKSTTIFRNTQENREKSSDKRIFSRHINCHLLGIIKLVKNNYSTKHGSMNAKQIIPILLSLTADCKSGGTPNGGRTYPALRNQGRLSMDKTTSPKPNLSANSVMRGLLESIIILRSLAETIEQQLSSHYHHYTSRCSSP